MVTGRCYLRRWLFLAFGVGVLSLLAFSYYLTHYPGFNSLVQQQHSRPKYVVGRQRTPFKCHSHNPDDMVGGSPIGDAVLGDGEDKHHSSAQLRLDAKVLVLVETQYSTLGRQIVELLEAARFKFKVEVAGRGGLPMLTSLDKGKFAAVVFENMDKFLTMSKWNKDLLLKYCREYKVGVVGFVHSTEEPVVIPPRENFPYQVHTKLSLQNAFLNPGSRILRMARPGEVFAGPLPGDDWSVFFPINESYIPVAWAQPLYYYPALEVNGTVPSLITVVQDPGTSGDRVQKVVFGNGFNFWLHRLLFLDALSYLSHGKLSLPLHRHILIDIDDIFVGERGTRMTPDDVHALLAAQERFQHMVSGFRFNLGFSGKFYHKGTQEENEGDDLLIQNADKFWWFCHMWSHSQPHLFDNVTALENEMRLNKDFAKAHGIPTDAGYSVAPHHSGVFPVHEPLYEAWKRVWNVRVTSTEEYPHLRPARLRRGFIHRNIMVLPRQTCGLYTHTIFFHKYPSGPEKLETSIHGGELFYTFVTNPVNVFMTHLSNYGNDRLGLYTFESVLRFVRCWTNLGLSTVPPLQLAEAYFQTYPEEASPLWKNPCEDKRHLAIWAPNKSCGQLPKFLVIGPQKTGTTALYTFLSMHPAIVSNYPSPETFEEVQFFNGRNYYRGLDWYMSFFPVPKNSTDKYLFEKSATYFDGELVPQRAHTLLPNAKLVTILISPVKRAYSWYQHMRTHKDPAALNYTFYEVVTAGEKAPRALRDLRNRCLNPGMYAQHLERWLSFYPPSQLMMIDGEVLKANPVLIMNTLQRFLQIKPFYDYNRHLRYDPRKGFFCQVTQRNSTHCLGRSKGRHYPPLSPPAEKFLRKFYLSHNVALLRLLERLRLPAPGWLREDLAS